MQPIIYIRADGNSQIGLGHLVRCISLSFMLKEDFDIHFVCKSAPDSIRVEIKEAGFTFTEISDENDFLKLLRHDDIVVLDHYGLTSQYQQTIKQKGCKLVCIDDLAEKEFYADLIINHAPGLSVQDYTAKPYTQFALGLQYALLKPVFLEAAKNIQQRTEFNKLFICFGGADPENYTSLVLNRILPLQFFKKIFVVTGSGYRFDTELKLLLHNYSEVEYHHNIRDTDMLKIMMQADLAIVPSSGISLECLAAGCRTISSFYVENQRRISEGLKKLNAAYIIDDFMSVSEEVLSKAIAYEYRKVIDGYSKERLIKMMNQLRTEHQLSLRRVTDSDLATTYNWAIDKSIRAFSYSQNEISLEEHTAWFKSKLKSDDCYYYLSELEGKPAGSIRFDIRNNEAIISYLIDSSFQGRGLGIVLLKMGIAALIKENEPRIQKIVGYVMPENLASVRAFEKFGFTRGEEEGKLKYSISIL